jgi:hypothetical protein
MERSMTTRATGPSLMVTHASGKVGSLPLYDSAKPGKGRAVVYMVKTLPDGIRLAYKRTTS